MKVTTERLPNSQVKVEIEVGPERVEKSIDDAYRRLAKRVKIPGFRPGKAPRPVVERHLGGRDALLHEALDKLVPEVYDEVVEEQDIHPIDLPQLSVTSIEPVTFTATVPIRPEIKLGDYKAIRIDHEPVEVEESRVDEALERLRAGQALLEPVERGVRIGDVLRADISAHIEDEEQFSREDAEFTLVEDGEVLQPGFKEQLVGMKKGHEKKFSLAVPEDHPDESRRGKTYDYVVALREVKERRLPDLDDDFARGIGEGYDNVAALRERIRADMQTELERQERAAYEMRILDRVLEISELEYPAVMVDREVEHQLTDHGGGQASFQEQLRRAGRSEDEFKAELRPAAEERVKRSLILSQLSEDEGVEVSDEEVNEELDRYTADMGENAARMREMLGSAEGRASISRSLKTRKTFDRLVAIAESSNGRSPARPVSPKASRKAATRKKSDKKPAQTK
ncbi:MAG TPA: trigger factor [Dehalococcoidia bacterium]|nr:trigger factor [Dehalococcoidia bacterium]